MEENMNKKMWPDGKYRDQLIRADGTIVDIDWRANIVVDRCRILLAGFMKVDTEAQGIQSIILGRGNAVWDTAPEAPAPATTELIDTKPVSITIKQDDMTYLDAAGEPTKDPTSRLQITVTLPPGTPPPIPGTNHYPLREFALMGSFAGEPYMIDYVRHPVVHKAAGGTLVRTIRLIF